MTLGDFIYFGSFLHEINIFVYNLYLFKHAIHYQIFHISLS